MRWASARSAITYVIVVSRAHFDDPTRNAHGVLAKKYRLVVDGELSDRLESAFDGMTLTREKGQTLLVGSVLDQAELQGLLQRVSDLGLVLISVTAIEDEKT
jgi:hypothetical protein